MGNPLEEATDAILAGIQPDATNSIDILLKQSVPVQTEQVQKEDQRTLVYSYDVKSTEEMIRLWHVEPAEGKPYYRISVKLGDEPTRRRDMKPHILAGLLKSSLKE